MKPVPNHLKSLCQASFCTYLFSVMAIHHRKINQGPNNESLFNLSQIALCRTAPESLQFRLSFHESYAIYRTYQMTVHKDSPEECDKFGYKRFLVDSPLEVIRLLFTDLAFCVQWVKVKVFLWLHVKVVLFSSVCWIHLCESFVVSHVKLSGHVIQSEDWCEVSEHVAALIFIACT